MRPSGHKTCLGMAAGLAGLLFVVMVAFPHLVWSAKSSPGLTTGSAAAMDRLEIDSGAHLSLGENCDLDVGTGGITNRGAITCSNGTISTAGVWENRGSFTRNTASVLLDGTNQTVLGDTHFYNLIKATTVTDTLTFETNSRQTIENNLTLTGAKDSRLSLQSDEAGTPWAIALEPGGGQILNWLDVKDSDASGGQTLEAFNSIDSGNNINWEFSGPGFADMDPIVLEVGKTAGPDQEDGTMLYGPGGEGSYIWSSSDMGIAVVSSDGMVTALACVPENGKNYSFAWITVTDGDGRDASKLVKVFDAMRVLPTALEDRTAGQSATLTVTGGTGIWLWETSDPDVATVVDGRVTFRSVGNAVITLKDGTCPDKFTPVTIAVGVIGQGSVVDEDLSFGWDVDGTTPVAPPGTSIGFFLAGGSENYTFSGTGAAWMNIAGTQLEIPDDAAAGIYELVVADGTGDPEILTFAVPLSLDPYTLSVLATTAGNDLVLSIREGSAAGNITWTLADAQAMASGFSLTDTSGALITNTIAKAHVDLAAVAMAPAWIKVTAHDDSLDPMCDVTTAMINVVPTNTLKIRAVDVAGSPIADARVQVLGSGQSAFMPGTGAAVFSELPYSVDARYRVRVSANGYLTAEQGDLAASGEVHDVILTRGAACFTGILTAGGQPLEGATVAAFNANDTCFYSVTNADGAFSIDVPSMGILNPWTVSAGKAGYLPMTLANRELGSGETSLGEISLTREIRVCWAVHRDKLFAHNNTWTIKMTAVPAFTAGDEKTLMFQYNMPETGSRITNYGWMKDAWFEPATGAVCIAYEADPFDTVMSADFMIEPVGAEAVMVTVAFDASPGTSMVAFTQAPVDSSLGGSASLIRAEISDGATDDTGVAVLPGDMDGAADPLAIRITRTDESAHVTGYQFAGGFYTIDLVDASGNIVNAGLINRVLITFEFDPVVWVPYEDRIFYREAGGTWTVFPNENILNVDYLNNTVTIESDHLSDWVLVVRNAGGDDENSGPGGGGGGCFINSTQGSGSLMIPLGALLAAALGFLCRNIRIPHMQRTHAPFFLVLAAVLILACAFTVEGRADDTRARFGAQVGMGYCHLNNDVSTDYNAIDSDFTARYSLYPVVRLDYRLAPQVALEADFAFNYYEWDLNNSLSDDSSHFYGYSVTLGPAIYSKKQNFPWLGQGIFYSRMALGWQILDMDLDFAVRNYDPAFGAEFAVGFQKEKLDFRCGIKCFRHDAGSLAYDFSTDSHNDSLDLSGVFFDVTWRFGSY